MLRINQKFGVYSLEKKNAVFKEIIMYQSTSFKSEVIQNVWNNDDAIGKWKHTFTNEFALNAWLDDIRIHSDS